MDTLECKAAIQIQKPVHEVFMAVIDPMQMQNYFISESTGMIEEGKELVWRFPEFDMELLVRIGKVEKDNYISFYWSTNDKELFVEIKFSSRPDNSTLVNVTEKAMENSEEGIKWLKGNTEGWANFLACLKAWVEYGINLRKGAFDFLRKENTG